MRDVLGEKNCIYFTKSPPPDAVTPVVLCSSALFLWLNFQTSSVTPDLCHQCHALISPKLGLVSQFLSLRKRKVGKSGSNDTEFHGFRVCNLRISITTFNSQ